MKKRVGLFVFFNAKGHVGNYVDFLLKEVIGNIDKLYIMVIGILDEDGKKILSKYSDSIVYKENKGFTGVAWKKALFEQIGFDELKKYDEAVFFNDIFYGPFIPLHDVFEEMDKKDDLDFWGITRHYQTKDFTGYYKDGIIPEHIQTYFYVVRKNMLNSKDFKNFWTNLEDIKTAKDDVGMQETHFTDYFSKLGYKWDTYVDMESLKGKDLNNYCMNYEIPYSLIKDYNMPFLRRKALVQIVSNSVSGPETEGYRTIEYIKENTDYDVNMIWDDLLFNNNIYDLYTRLHLDYVLSADSSNKRENNNRVLIIIDTEGCDDDFYKLYIDNLDKRYDVLVLKEDNDIDISKYDYVCYIRNEIMNNENILLNKSYKELIYDNAIVSNDYINNIITTFEKEERLGILYSPMMIGESYWQNIPQNFNSRDFDNVKNILNELNISVNISSDTNMISNTKALWIKTKSINNKTIKSFKDIIYALPYIAQSSGYYSGVVFNKEYASLYIDGLNEEYRRYRNTHPYAAPDSIPFSILFKAIFRKIQRKFTGK